MKAVAQENKKKKTPPVGYSIPMLMRHYYGLAQPASPIVCADSGLEATPGMKRVLCFSDVPSSSGFFFFNVRKRLKPATA